MSCFLSILLWRDGSVRARILGVFAQGQDLRTVVGDGDRVLEVRCEFTILRDNCPAVTLHVDPVAPSVIIGSMARTSPRRSTMPVPRLP